MNHPLPPGPSPIFGAIAAAVVGALAAQPRVWDDLARHAPPLVTAVAPLPDLVAAWSAPLATLMHTSGAALRGKAPSPATAAPLGLIVAAEALALALRHAGAIVGDVAAAACDEAKRADAGAPVAGVRLLALGAVAQVVGRLTMTNAFAAALADAGVLGARMMGAQESFAAALAAYGNLATALAPRLRASRGERRKLRSTAPLRAEAVTTDLVAALHRLGAIVAELIAGACAEAVEGERLWRLLHAPRAANENGGDLG